MTLQSYRELDVWQRAMELATACYELTLRLPRDETYGLRAQVRRAAVSVPANIAEGYGRSGRGEYAYHLSVANGSLKELETHLELIRRLGYAAGDEITRAEALCDRVGRMLRRLRSAVSPTGRATPICPHAGARRRPTPD